MGKKKELMSSAPWRGDEDESDIFEDAKMKITRQPGSDPTLHVPAKKSAKKSGSDYDDDEPVFDPELRYSFQRNMQFLGRVFTVDTLVKPLPPVMAYNVSRNINFFLRIFTQFWDEEGIANAQKSLGLGQEDRDHRVR
ncbi:hypothetical protein FCM35_KLT09623 [Carex littledalei]|uniref:Uncharacterized protein n=1 Tax=Carex littledalei TaxID=544730 RepID=A0A833RGD0_9POAL|nr:hypothetical protein FCM35_KLT09622 [Carex littledalei]KAF3340779.1 hypothetical protein FCM35_KLT09623 [Carex littledalei]